MSRAGPLCRDRGTLVKSNKNQLCDYTTTEPARLAGIPVLPGSRVEIFHIITLTERPGEWTKWETGQRVMNCSCALLPRLMWSGTYCELYFQAVWTWKLWNLPLPWFVYERIQLNLINSRFFKNRTRFARENVGLFPQFDRERMQLVYEVILLDKILKIHLLSENMQWNYASFNVTLNYVMYEIMEFCVISSLAGARQLRAKILSNNKPNHSHRHTPCAAMMIIFQRENLNY